MRFARLVLPTGFVLLSGFLLYWLYDVKSDVAAIKPTYSVELALDPSRYSEFDAALGEKLTSMGLTRGDAAPGLDDLKNRKVFYVEYHQGETQALPFLTATDILKSGQVVVRVYPEALQDQATRSAALSLVSQTLAHFGVRLDQP
jgi:hypothetical protein